MEEGGEGLSSVSVIVLRVEDQSGKETLVYDRQALATLRSFPLPHNVIGGMGQYGCNLSHYLKEYRMAVSHEEERHGGKKQLRVHAIPSDDEGGTLFLLDPSPGFGSSREDATMAHKFYAAVVNLTTSLLIFNVRGAISNDQLRLLSLSHAFALCATPNEQRPQHLVVLSQDVDDAEFTKEELEDLPRVLSGYFRPRNNETVELKEHKEHLNSLYPLDTAVTFLGVPRVRRRESEQAAVSAYQLGLRSALIAIDELAEEVGAVDWNNWEEERIRVMVDALNELESAMFKPAAIRQNLAARALVHEAIVCFRRELQQEEAKEEEGTEWDVNTFIAIHKRASDAALLLYRSRCKEGGVSRIEQDKQEKHLDEAFHHAFLLGKQLVEEEDLFVLLGKLGQLVRWMQEIEQTTSQNRKELDRVAQEVAETLRYAAQVALYGEEVIAHARQLHQTGRQLIEAVEQQIKALRRLQRKSRRCFFSVLAGVVGLAVTVFSFGSALPAFVASLGSATASAVATLSQGLQLVGMADHIVGTVTGKGFLPTPVHHALNIVRGVGALSQGVDLNSLSSVSKFTHGLADVSSAIPGAEKVSTKLRAIAGLTGGIASFASADSPAGLRAVSTGLETAGHAANLVGAEDVGQKLLMAGTLLANGQTLVGMVKDTFSPSMEERMEIEAVMKGKEKEVEKSSEKEKGEKEEQHPPPCRQGKASSLKKASANQQDKQKGTTVAVEDWYEGVFDEPLVIYPQASSPTPATPAIETTSLDGQGTSRGEIGSMVLDMIPVVGTVKSVWQLITGKDAVTGEEVNRGMQLLGIIPVCKVAGVLGKGTAKVLQRVAGKTAPKAAGAVSRAMKKPVEAGGRDWVRKMAGLDKAYEKGTLRIVEGAEYEAARKLGNAAATRYRSDLERRIQRMYQAKPEQMQRMLDTLKRSDIDHIIDIKAGGNPVARSNLRVCDRKVNRSSGSQLPKVLKQLLK